MESKKQIEISPSWGQKEFPKVTKKLLNADTLKDVEAIVLSEIQMYNYKGYVIYVPVLYARDKVDGTRLDDYELACLNDINLITICKKIDEELKDGK